jgi:hypothetical protein
MGGGVYTVDAVRWWADAVAIRGEHIVAIGTEREVAGWIGPGTEVVDLDGCMVLPGFQDCHVHAPSGGLERLQLDLSGCSTRADLLDEIRRYAEKHAEEPWIVGSGWGADHFSSDGPTKDELDAVLPDRPALITDRNRHNAWVNTRALALAGITCGSADPSGGRIDRDATGEPTGLLAETAIDLVARAAPPITAERRCDALLRAQEYLHSLGITAWQDALVGSPGSIDDSFETYLELDQAGRLTARVVGALWYEREQGLDQLPSLVERRRRAVGGRFRATTVKVMVDGSMEGRSASLFEPFLDADGRVTDNVGLAFFEPDELRAAIVALDAEGFQVHIHVLGDRACADALDALEAAIAANGRNDHRHHLAHVHLVRPHDVPRLRPLGVTATMQPLWAAHGPPMDHATIPWLGPERASWQYPIASLVANGTALAFGSDWPVSSPDPIWGMHVAVNRMLPPGHPDAVAWAGRGPFIPNERIDLPTAIAAYTIGAAYVNHLDERTGSIEVGKLADLVVLDRNLFDRPADEIGDAKVLRTIVGGRTVFER